MKNRGTTQSKGLLSRLVRESLILSCLEAISSRLISFFKNGLFSYILTGGGASDAALHSGGFGSTADENRLKARFNRSVKQKVALSFENSFIVGRYRDAVRRAVCTPVSTYGMFTATLGIYICLVYFVKLYGFTAADTQNISSLITGLIVIAASVPLLLCRKSLARALSESAFFGAAFSGLVELDAYGDEKGRGAAGMALIAGSVLGVLSFFSGEIRILAFVAAVVFLLLVAYSPECGLLTAALVFPFCPAGALCAVICASLFSYVVKVLRGKRNFRLNTAGIFMLILCLCFLFETAGGGRNALFAFCMAALYLLTANLLTTQALLSKAANVLTIGLGAAVAVYAMQVFMAAFSGGDWYTALVSSFSVFGSGKRFAAYVLLCAPFVFCKAQGGGFIAKLYGYLVVVACIIYSVLYGSVAYAILAALAASLYLAVAGRRLFRPFLLCFAVPVGGLYFAAVPISFGDMGFYNTLSCWIDAFKAGGANWLFGCGMSDASTALAFGGDSRSLYLQIFVQCGAAGFLLLAAALCFALQRLYVRLDGVGSENRSITAAAGASSVTGLIMGMGINLWADKDLSFIFWFGLGIAAAAYEVRKERRRGVNDEQIV